MQWFKHDADASNDAKIKKLLLRHGAEGYAIYFHCLELIAGDISESNITFQLEHDSEIIADNLKIRGTAEKSGIELVEDSVKYMVELGLFDQIDNRIFCFKMLKRLDTSMTSSPKMRTIIKSAKQNHDSIMTTSCKKRIEQNRIEQNREVGSGLFQTEEKANSITKALDSQEVEKVYKHYPSRCPVKDRSTGKSRKDKEKIKKLLKQMLSEQLMELIDLYVKDCIRTGTPIKNLYTFLNNLPEKEELTASSQQGNLQDSFDFVLEE